MFYSKCKTNNKKMEARTMKRQNNKVSGWAWKLTPVIPAIWEAEIGRIEVQDWLRQKVSKSPF
jgi:hypothetical protein